MDSSSKLQNSRASRNCPDGPDDVKEHLFEGTRKKLSLSLRLTEVHTLRAAMRIHLLRRKNLGRNHEANQELQKGDTTVPRLPQRLFAG